MYRGIFCFYTLGMFASPVYDNYFMARLFPFRTRIMHVHCTNAYRYVLGGDVLC